MPHKKNYCTCCFMRLLNDSSPCILYEWPRYLNQELSETPQEGDSCLDSASPSLCCWQKKRKKENFMLPFGFLKTSNPAVTAVAQQTRARRPAGSSPRDDEM